MIIKHDIHAVKHIKCHPKLENILLNKKYTVIIIIGKCIHYTLYIYAKYGWAIKYLRHGNFIKNVKFILKLNREPVTVHWARF